MKLTDPHLNERLKRDGLIKISLLSESELTKLSSFISRETEIEELGKTFGFYQAVMLQSADIKRKIHKFVGDVVNPRLSSVITDHKSLAFSVLVNLFHCLLFF